MVAWDDGRDEIVAAGLGLFDVESVVVTSPDAVTSGAATAVASLVSNAAADNAGLEMTDGKDDAADLVVS